MDSSPLTSMIFPYFPSQTTMASGISPMDSIWILHDSTIKIHRSIDPPSSGRSPDSWYEGRWHWPKCSSSSPGRWPGSYWEMIWEKGSNLDDFLGGEDGFFWGKEPELKPAKLAKSYQLSGSLADVFLWLIFGSQCQDHSICGMTNATFMDPEWCWWVVTSTPIVQGTSQCGSNTCTYDVPPKTQRWRWFITSASLSRFNGHIIP